MTTFKEATTLPPSTELTLPVRTIEEKEISKQLRDRLDSVDALEGALQAMTTKYNEVLEDLGKVNSEMQALRQLDIKQKELIEKRELLEKVKADLEYSTQLDQLRVSMADQRVKDHIEMVKLIFRNPITRIKSTVPVAVRGGTQTSGQYNSDGSPIMQENPGYVSDETSESAEEEL